MSSLRSGPVREFRPTRSTRSTSGAAATSATAAASGIANTTRSRSTSRPPSGIATNGRPGSAAGSITASRPGSSAGPASGATRAGLGNNANRASAPAPSTTAATGIKRKTRSTSSSVETQQDPKRPALSSAFSTHVSQTSLNRQLLDAQAQITKLENTVQDKQREITRLEADLVLVATREEEERTARTRIEDELARKTSQYETELSSLRRKLAELETDQEDLSDAYSNLSHTTQSQISSLRLELTSSNERIRLLELQLKEAETNAQEQEIRAKALEELLEQVTEEGGDGDESEEGETEKEKSASSEQKSSRDDEAEQKQEAIEFKEPESSVADSASVQGEAEGSGDSADIDADVDADVDADGDAEDEEESMDVEAVEGDVTPTREVEASSARSVSPAGSNVFYEGGQPEPYQDPGAPPPYTASPAPGSSASTSTGLRSRSASIASTQNGSIASSSMSITYDGPPLPHVSLRSTESSISIASSSKLDPLSHIRRRLSFATPGRCRSSVNSPREHGREKDNEIIRAELARQTSHITSLESANARLTSEIARLRDRAQGAELLREEKRELERRVEAMESLRAHAAELEATVAESAKRERELQSKLKQQERVNDENAIPVGVTKELATLRKSHAALLDEHGELKAALRANEVELAEAREEADDTQREAERLKDQVEHLQRAIARKEKERTLLEDDVTFLRSLVSSYKNEESADISMETGEEPHHPETEKLERRVAQLESLLMEYKRTILSLEQEVDRLRRAGSAATNKSQDEWNQLLEKASNLEEAFKSAQTESVKQSELVEELEQRLFELGGEIGGGRHIPPGTRVLSMRKNPAQEWADTRQAVLDRLKAENEALLARLKDLEEQGRSIPAALQSDSDHENSQFVPRISWETVKKEKEELEVALSQKQKRLDRLQEIYSKKSREFREAIESILGVKLAFYPNGQVRLTSIYDLSATFVFQPSDSADKGGTKLQLVATGDSTPPELDGLMNMWLRDEMCIPCFMSSVTLECYDKWKIEQREAGLHNK